MNPEKINKAIHTILGKCWHDYQWRVSDMGGRNIVCTKCDCLEQKTPPIPEYTNDLNAVAEAERFVIEKVGKWDYAEILLQTAWEMKVNADGLDYYDIATAATASALQRATACLKALGGKG